MHCTDQELLQQHSEQTAEHLASCKICQQRLAMLQGLRSDAQALPMLQPSAMAWDKVQQRLPKQVQFEAQTGADDLSPSAVLEVPKHSEKAANESIFQRFKMPLLLAASFVVGVLVTQFSHQMGQLDQLDEQIALSRQYESQLVALKMTSPFVEAQLWQISEIDQQLNTELSAKQRQQLWRKRNEILLQMLTMPSDTNEMI